jgi:hypothetical protein
MRVQNVWASFLPIVLPLSADDYVVILPNEVCDLSEDDLSSPGLETIVRVFRDASMLRTVEQACV